MIYFFYQNQYVCVETKPNFMYALYENGWGQIHPNEILDGSMSEIDEDEFRKRLQNCAKLGFEARKVDPEIRESLKSLVNQHRDIVNSRTVDETIEKFVFWGGWIGGCVFIMSLINYSAMVADVGTYGVTAGLILSVFAIFNHYNSFAERNYQKRFAPIKDKLLEFGLDGFIVHDRIFRPGDVEGIDVFDDKYFS